jgi:hypothetical protein
MKLFQKGCFAVALAALLSTTINVEAANPRGGRISVPVMTALTVKLDEAVNTTTAVNGAGFTASIKEPVQVDGIVVIPTNASAGGLITKGSQSTAELELNSVFVNGRSYRIMTEPVPFNQKINLRAGSTITFHLVLSLNIAR